MRLLKWFRDSVLGIRCGLLASRNTNMFTFNISQPVQTVTEIDNAITFTMPAISDFLHNTGDVFILTSLLTHCVLTKDVFLQTIIRMPAWIFLAIVCSNNVRIRDDRCAVLQEFLRLGIIIYYGLKLNFSFQLQKIIRSAKDRGLLKDLKSDETPETPTLGVVRPKRRERLLSEEEVEKFYKGIPTLLKGDEPIAYTTLPFDKLLEISHSNFSTYESLPQQNIRCQNGLSFQGMLHCNNKKIRACVKTNVTGDLESLRGLMMEIKLLKFVGQHDNLQSLFGVCSKHIITSGKIFLIMENCGDRTLEMHLQELQRTENSLLIPQKTLRENLLIDFYRWAYEISSGMKFITSKGIVHGKLTNECIILNEVGTVKLTDYGTAPYLEKTDTFKPEKWERDDWKYLSPEAIVKNQFTVAGDVWSFGVVLWKIFTVSSDPFPAFKEYSKIFPLTLLDGGRPEADNRIPQYMFDLLTKCWLIEPDKRPNFDTCCQYTYVKTKPKRRIVTCDDDDFIT